MLIKLGSNISVVSGSIAGHTYQKSSGGVQVRNKPVPLRNPSQSQIMIRSYNKQLQKGWKELTDFQRSAWDDYAWTFGIKNRFGDHHVLSGHSLWMKYNFAYLYDHLPMINSPFTYKDVRFGPELIVNGNLTSAVNWSFQGSFSWQPGYAVKSSGASGYFFQNIPDQPIGSFMITIDVSDCVIISQLSPYRTGPDNFFSPIKIFNLAQGSNSYYISGSTNGIATICLFSAQNNLQSFKVTNISLKQIL